MEPSRELKAKCYLWLVMIAILHEHNLHDFSLTQDASSEHDCSTDSIRAAVRYRHFLLAMAYAVMVMLAKM